MRCIREKKVGEPLGDKLLGKTNEMHINRDNGDLHNGFMVYWQLRHGDQTDRDNQTIFSVLAFESNNLAHDSCLGIEAVASRGDMTG
uniref:Uncharacterized protein n=1 Tax=Tanacetum cinerariifolium TaxID=118510 RepID=A0A6L2N3Y4_TANCI|nr:hypothetical protein [Tanacetum cinerariifolium]